MRLTEFYLLICCSVDTKTFVLPDLGKLKRVRVLHDNSGAAPSWFLKKVLLLQIEKLYLIPGGGDI